jgi:hypothetical protein
MDLRESTTVTINMGPFVDKTDGVTPETALTLTVKLTKNAGTLAARNSATAITHDADGYYKVELNTTDTNTRGRLRATATDSTTYVPMSEDFNVLAAAEYDRKYGAPLALQAAAASTATLDAGASAVNDFYVGSLLRTIGGTGAGQVRRVLGYVGSTKVATLDRVWATNPTAGTTFELIADASVVLTALERTAVADAVLAAAATTPIDVNLKKINNITLQGTGDGGTPWRPA